MKSACLKAGVKLGMGLSLLVAVIGIRLVTATAEGVESGVRELERLEAEIASEAMVANPENSAARSVPADDSIGNGIRGRIRDLTANSDSSAEDGDKLVSCRLGGRTHFMRARDCAMRSGQSTVLSEDR